MVVRSVSFGGLCRILGGASSRYDVISERLRSS